MTHRRRYRQHTLLSGLALGASISAGPIHAQDGYPPLDVLLQSQTTVIGQPFSYPDGAAEVTVAIVTMQPGEVTAWHLHEAPLIAHILEGEITLDYGTDGIRTFAAGDTFVEAFRSRHRGTNTGKDILRILAVFAGAEGTANTILE
jgi:quercetin dioxygenase-like cupin family protein